MNCREVNELLVAYLDGEVTPSEREMIAAHLAECASCREEMYRLMQMQRRLSRSLKAMAADVSPSPQAWSHLQARLTKRAPQELWPQRLAPDVWHKLTKVCLMIKGEILTKHKLAVAVVTTLVLAITIMASIPTVRSQAGEWVARRFHIEFLGGEVALERFHIEFLGGEVALEMSGPSVEFSPLQPTYLPAVLQGSGGGIVAEIDDGSEFIELKYSKDERFISITQTKAPADKPLPAGQEVTVNGQPAVLVTGIDGKRLTCYSGEVKVELLSNLSVEEMLKVAESMAVAEAGESEG